MLSLPPERRDSWNRQRGDAGGRPGIATYPIANGRAVQSVPPSVVIQIV
jgi:hypothetical protein